MRHEDAIERLPGLLGLRPAGTQELELRRHVDDCGDCQERLAALQEVDRGLRRLQEENPSSDLEQRVLAIPQHAPPDAGRAPPRRRAWLGAAAAIAAVLAVTASLILTRGGGTDRAFAVVRAVTLSAPGGGVQARLELAKPDGANQPVRLVASGLSPTAAPYYTLWLIGEGRRVSAGTFRPDADGDCMIIGVVPRDITWSQVTITRADARPESAERVAVGNL